MEVKPGYKQTDVGMIPQDWDVSTLQQLCVKIQDGTHFSPTIRGGEFLYVTSKNIGFGVLDVTDAPRIDAAQHRSIYARCDVRRGDVLLTKDGANTGNAALNTLDEEFSLLSSVAFLRFDPRRHSSSYFLQQILAGGGQRRIKEAMSGNAITRLTLAKINKLIFPHPLLPEQHAIATALSDVDALLNGLDRLIAKKRDLKQAAMQQLLTGQTRLPGFHGEWEVKRLGEVAEMGSGGTPLSSVPAYYGGDIPWVSIADMTRGGKVINMTEKTLTPLGLANSAAQMFPAGTVLYAMYASLGECSIAGIPVCTSQAILGIRPKERLHNEYLYYFLTAIRAVVKTLGQQGTQSNLNKGMVQDLRLGLPSRNEQIAIATVLSDMDAELAALEARRDKTRALKQAMMQELLTGRTRLVTTGGAHG